MRRLREWSDTVLGDYSIPKKIPQLLRYILMTIFSKRLDKFRDKLRIKELRDETLNT